MALLNRQGFAAETRKVGRERVYYVEDRQFSVSELKILIDAVQDMKPSGRSIFRPTGPISRTDIRPPCSLQ